MLETHEPAPAREGHGAPLRARQGARRAPAHARGGGRAPHPVHDRDPARDRRERRDERVDTLLAIRELADRYGHIQEVHRAAVPSEAGHADARASRRSRIDEVAGWVALARLVLGPAMNVQAPPNLAPDALELLLRAGVNDWGGVSPLTIDFINPEAPWPTLRELRERTEAAGAAARRAPAGLSRAPRATPTSSSRRVREAALARVGRGRLRSRRQRAWRLPDARTTARATSSPGVAPDPRRRARRTRARRRRRRARCSRARGADLHALTARGRRSRARDDKGDDVSYVDLPQHQLHERLLRRLHVLRLLAPRATRPTPTTTRWRSSSRRRATRSRAARPRSASRAASTRSKDHTHYREILDRAQGASSRQLHIHAFSPEEIDFGHQKSGHAARGATCAGSSTRASARCRAPRPRSSTTTIREIISPRKLRRDRWVEIVTAAHAIGLRSTLDDHVRPHRDSRARRRATSR